MTSLGIGVGQEVKSFLLCHRGLLAGIVFVESQKRRCPQSSGTGKRSLRTNASHPANEVLWCGVHLPTQLVAQSGAYLADDRSARCQAIPYRPDAFSRKTALTRREAVDVHVLLFQVLDLLRFAGRGVDDNTFRG